MVEPEPPQVSSEHPLEELLRESDFLKVLELITQEAQRCWGVPDKAARGFVLSVIGEPETLARIHHAWVLAKNTGQGLGKAKALVRRCVIDLLREDAKQPGHRSTPPPASDAMGPERPLGSFHALVRRSPRVERELQLVIHMIRDAMACFDTQGRTQHHQSPSSSARSREGQDRARAYGETILCARLVR